MSVMGFLTKFVYGHVWMGVSSIQFFWGFFKHCKSPYVTCHFSQGLDAFKREMLSLALDTSHFPHLGHPYHQGTLKLFRDLLKMRNEEGTMLMTCDEIKDIGMKQVSSEQTLLNELHHLHTVVCICMA